MAKIVSFIDQWNHEELSLYPVIIARQEESSTSTHLLSALGNPLAIRISTVTAEEENSDARLSPPRLSSSCILNDPLAVRLLPHPRMRDGRSGRDVTTPCAMCGTKSPESITYGGATEYMGSICSVATGGG